VTFNDLKAKRVSPSVSEVYLGNPTTNPSAINPLTFTRKS